MNKSKLLIFISSISFACNAFAMMSAPFGWYVEPNIGYSKLADRGYDGSISNSGMGWNVNAGYKFMPFFAAEIGYTRYANNTVKNNGSTVGTDRHYSYHLSARGIFPMNTSGFEFVGKIGIMRINSNPSITDPAGAAAIGWSSGSKSTTGLYLGVGGQYYFTPEIPVILQWQRAKGNSSTGTMDLYSIGISYLFS